MIKSMTGYGRGDKTDGVRSVTAEIRAVNHRYCEISVKMPGKFMFAEDSIKTFVKTNAGRGKIDVGINITSTAEEDTSVLINNAVAKQYFFGLRELQKEFDVEGEISLQMLASMPDVLKQGKPEYDEDVIRSIILGAVTSAFDSFNNMRISEGANLEKDILQRLDKLNDIISEIETKAPEIPAIYAEKLKERIGALTEKTLDPTVLEQRLAMEIAVFTDKASIEEEIVRFKSHINQFRCIIMDKDCEDPVGKKLDFIVQEMNREANTIGSKANDLQITNHMIEMKNEIENIREQIQNIC